MPGSPPVVYLLVGLPGSGKTACARDLESHGVVRLSVDEAMTAKHGRLGSDHTVEEYLELLEPVVGHVRSRLVDHVRSGRSVVLDHGLGLKIERDEWKRLVADLGATWELLYFTADIETLLVRLAHRGRIDPDAVPITEEMLRSMAESWEPPKGEGEQLAAEASHRFPS